MYGQKVIERMGIFGSLCGQGSRKCIVSCLSVFDGDQTPQGVARGIAQGEFSNAGTDLDV
jgi:hypothetical protein